MISIEPFYIFNQNIENRCKFVKTPKFEFHGSCGLWRKEIDTLRFTLRQGYISLFIWLTLCSQRALDDHGMRVNGLIELVQESSDVETSSHPVLQLYIHSNYSINSHPRAKHM